MWFVPLPDINECQRGVGGGGGAVCPAHAKCYNTLPGYSCICEDGFAGPLGLEHLTINHTCEGKKKGLLVLPPGVGVTPLSPL